MFNVGRYDPNEEKRKRTTISASSKAKRRKRPRKGATNMMGAKPTETKLELVNNEDHGSESDSSSSVPTSSDESKYLQNQSTLRVIAPKAPEITKNRNIGMADEGFDDFDVDTELLDTNINVTEEVDNDALDNSERNEVELPQEIKTALHMSSLPIEEAAKAWDLAPFLIENLKRDGYKQFFPIQSLVIPDVIASERHSHIRARDVCVSAPTGSGKTLGFVLPVLNALSKRQVRRLRALIILPSRDLASQVYQVFERYTHGSDLRVGLAIGQSDFKAEQIALSVGSPDLSDMEDLGTVRHRYALNENDLDLALEAFPGFTNAEAPPNYELTHRLVRLLQLLWSAADLGDHR
jgi:ATP-dependent RNA helicase DDX51/DBP6